MTASAATRWSGDRWFPEPGLDQADEGVDRRIFVGTVRTDTDPVAFRYASGQQHEHRLPVDGTLGPGEVLDRDFGCETRGRLREQGGGPSMKAARISHHDLHGAHALQTNALSRSCGVEGQPK